MLQLRFKALQSLENKVEPYLNGKNSEPKKISDIFGMYVFNDRSMKDYLTKEAYQSVKAAIDKGEKIDRKIADQVASGMKNWAMDNGATHYTHWFQPLTGLTAEKHDAFFVLKDGVAMEAFSGDSLIQQEPDASSFPSGGIRNTFEARGYTAWDPSSPAFLIKTRNSNTLCIPTIFVSYTGEALDYKAPLLRAVHFMEKAAVDVCQYFDPNIKKVTATLGIEQEYFLIDAQMVQARPDLLLTGRTLFGHNPAKGQQLEDHYFGSIPERVNAFMVDLETESLKLGIPLKTRHNEVAPSQFECAPMFEDINTAVDHNQLLMDMITKIALRHNFVAILHEKPFKGVNGSGKHNNWSMGTDTGVNLLSPGDTPQADLSFLTFLLCTIKAVHDYSDLLRASIASASNDHRLGANEAPPAIMSVFMGSTLSRILDQLNDDNPEHHTDEAYHVEMDIPKIPEILRDNTDRNRTSPFAFTGNKFEFRAVGSSSNSSSPMIVLSTIVGNQLIEFKKEVDSLIADGEEKEAAILKVIKRYNNESKTIRFEGNNYSEEWKKEALGRGMKNITTTPEALDIYLEEKVVKLFKKNNIFTEREIKARHEIKLDIYIKNIQIESRLTGELALTYILPAAVQYQNLLIDNVKGLKEIGLSEDAEEIINTVKALSQHINEAKKKIDKMIGIRKSTNIMDDAREKAIIYCHQIKPLNDQIRYHCDKLELMVEDKSWPLPKYRELLFLR